MGGPGISKQVHIERQMIGMVGRIRVIPPHVFRYPRIRVLRTCPRIRKSGPAYSRIEPRGPKKSSSYSAAYPEWYPGRKLQDTCCIWRRYPEKMSGYVNFGILGYARILGYQKRILGYGCGITLFIEILELPAAMRKKPSAVGPSVIPGIRLL